MTRHLWRLDVGCVSASNYPYYATANHHVGRMSVVTHEGSPRYISGLKSKMHRTRTNFPYYSAVRTHGQVRGMSVVRVGERQSATD